MGRSLLCTHLGKLKQKGTQLPFPGYSGVITAEGISRNGNPVAFSDSELGQKKYKLFGLVTNRDLPWDQLIWWSRERCGKGEEMHAIMKHDLAGSHLRSAHFGANAAW